MKEPKLIRQGLRSGGEFQRNTNTTQGRGIPQGRGRGRGRGTSFAQAMMYADSQKNKQSPQQAEEDMAANGTTIDDMELVEHDRSLDVIREDENTEHRTIHSGETVRKRNIPDIMETRININLFVPPSEDSPDKEMINVGKKWFAKMVDTDNSCRLIPWFEDDSKEGPITSHLEIPSTLSKFKKYFSKARPKVEGGPVYMEVNLMHTKAIADIKEDMEWWLKKEKITIYVKAIQAENTSRLGWLLFSFKEINTKVFDRELSCRLGAQISARFKPISTGTWDKSIDYKTRLKALHLECDKKVVKQVQLKLSTFYGSTSNEFPMGIRMRLVPEYNEIKGNLKIVQKVANLRAKQAHFLRAIVNITSEDILSLDVVTSASPQTLREKIMGVKSWTGDKATLFHAVNESWDGNRVVFTCTPTHAENANLIVQALIPYMIHHHGEGMKDFFDPNMLLEKDDWKWNEETKILDNPHTRAIDAIEGVDLDYDFKDHEPVEIHDIIPATFQPESPSRTNITSTHLDRILAGAEADSVSTLGNPHTPGHKSSSSIAITTGSTNSSLSPSLSGHSIASIDSRVSNIEEKINNLEVSLTNTIQRSMAEAMRNLQSAGDDSSGSDL